MTSYALTFPSGTTQYLLDADIHDLHKAAPPQQSIVITDDNVFKLYGEKLAAYKVITMPPGEANKSLATIEKLTQQLIDAGAHRGTMLVGVGGGVVTDVTGYLASTFMRGLKFGFVPTTLLAMVDAAIGGKNGVNVGLHKNMLGTIRQPEFILFDADFLTTLPDVEWSNGFAEVIKYGHIADARILGTLQKTDVTYFQMHPDKLNELISGCVDVKNKIVHADETESGLRKVLNFGHTAGHAFETLYGVPHGHAVGLGMRVAAKLSEEHKGLNAETGVMLAQLLERFGLPVTLDHDKGQVMEVLKGDKKRNAEGVDYVLIEKPGVAVTKVLAPGEIEGALSVVAAPPTIPI
jgi:3-dehydroquinate synthase